MASFAITNDLNWTVSKRFLSFVGNDGGSVPISEKVAVVRDDTGSFLGAVGPEYEIVQNSVLMGMIEPMIQEGLLSVANVGYLNGGARVFVQAEVSQEFEVLGESYKGFITLLNGHIGNASVAIGPSNVRVICGNTFSMSHAQIGEKFRHHAGVNARVLDSTAVIDYVNGAMRKYAEYMEPLALAPCNSVQFRNALEVIYEKEVKDMRASFVDQLNGLFYRGAGNEGKTYADAFHAVTDYNSNRSRKTATGRFNYSNFGQGAKIGQRALGVLSELAAV